MDVQKLEQGIIKHIEEVYDLFRQDVARITERETLAKLCELDSQKMYNYALAVKKQMNREIDNLSLDNGRKERLLSEVSALELPIPAFNLSEHDYMEEVAVESAVSQESKQNLRQHGGLLNAGLPIGAVAGIGLGVIVANTAPLIIAGGIGGAIVGAMAGRALSSKGGTKASHQTSSTPAVRQTVVVMSQRKIDVAVQARKQQMLALFSNYIRQVERKCQSIMN